MPHKLCVVFQTCILLMQKLLFITGLNLEYLSEKERQKELLRLKQEKKRAMRADKFENAAVLVGLAERQQAELLEK